MTVDSMTPCFLKSARPGAVENLTRICSLEEMSAPRINSYRSRWCYPLGKKNLKSCKKIRQTRSMECSAAMRIRNLRISYKNTMRWIRLSSCTDMLLQSIPGTQVMSILSCTVDEEAGNEAKKEIFCSDFRSITSVEALSRGLGWQKSSWLS